MVKEVDIMLEKSSKSVEILQSKGLFYFQGLFNASINFERDTTFEMVEDNDLLVNLQLNNCKVEGEIHLKFEKSCMVFHQVHFNRVDYFCYITCCNKLTISFCTGHMDLSRLHFEEIKINFMNAEDERLFVKGPIHVKYLVLYDIPKDMGYLTNILAQFKSIKCLTIGCLPSNPCINLEHYLTDWQAFTTYFEENDDSVFNYSDMETIEDRLNRISTFFLKTIFKKWRGISNLERLEYDNLYLSNRNCFYLRYLRCLQVLKAPIERIHRYSLDYLPSSILSIDLQGSYLGHIEFSSHTMFHSSLLEFHNLKIFVIDGKFYADPNNLCFLPKSLEILVISYYDINFSDDIFNGSFVKLRELYVRSFQNPEGDEMQVLSQSLVDFLNGLFLYIDRSCLEHLLIVEKRINYQIDPFTLDITNTRYETLGFGIEMR